MMFRFHPSVKWERGYPDRQQILSQVKQVWEKYGLETRTKFNTPVDKVYQDEKGRWVVNNTANGHFEGVIAAVGTCGEPKMPHIPGMENFKGHVYHSSQLTGYEFPTPRYILVRCRTNYFIERTPRARRWSSLVVVPALLRHWSSP